MGQIRSNQIRLERGGREGGKHVVDGIAYRIVAYRT